jgi:ABC-type glycerol-3-phosphate transport system substrate-binding protein
MDWRTSEIESRHSPRQRRLSSPVELVGILSVLVLCMVVLGAAGCSTTSDSTTKDADGTASGRVATSGVSRNDAVFARAFEDMAEGLEVEGTGTVESVLEDDTEGSRHQRFIVRLGSGQTLLVAHNIDIAPRVRGLEVGDTVSFKGEYEWNEQGGVVHWTHHDPDGSHPAGWIEHEGRRYQ